MKKRVFAALISLISMNVVCLSLLTFAWFTSNQKSENALDTITAVSSEQIAVDFKIYAWDDDNKAGIESPNFKLDQYDSFITSRNVNISKIIRFEITHKKTFTEADSFSLTVPCSGNFTIESGSETYVDNNISNIIRFRTLVDNANNSDDADAIYTTARTQFDAMATSSDRTYVTYEVVPGDEEGESVRNYSKVDTLVFNNLKFNTSGDKTYFFLEYNYSIDLVNYYYEHSDIDAPSVDTLEGDEISFTCDISKMTFNVMEGAA